MSDKMSGQFSFDEILKPGCRKAIYREEGYFVWCGSIAKYRNTYYLFYSRWKKELGFDAWVTDSEICIASGEDLMGEFVFQKVLFGKEIAGRWDASCKHNPQVLEADGKFYLYYMGNYGNGEFWNHRNHQRIGVAWCTDPMGEWQRPEEPVIDVSNEGYDSLMTSNPAAALTPDYRTLMIYKGVAQTGKMPVGGTVACCVAFADHPEGPFEKCGIQIMKNPEQDWSVEDPFIWYQKDRFYALVKDFHGYFIKTGEVGIALFESFDGMDWRPAEHPFAFDNRIQWEPGKIQRVHRLERPQIYFENGKAKALLCACCLEKDQKDSFHIRFELEN